MTARGADLGPDVLVTPPYGYRSSLALQLHAAAVLTNSGGVQREAGWLGVPCLVLRSSTEWVELLEASEGRMVLVGLDRAADDERAGASRPDRTRRHGRPCGGPDRDTGRPVGRCGGGHHRHAQPGGVLVMSDGLHVCFVTANTFEYDSRTLRAAQALAADGHRITVVSLQGPGLPAEETLAGGIRVVRPDLDRRVASAFRPLPTPIRRLLARALGFDAEAIALPTRGAGWLERLRGPLRRRSRSSPIDGAWARGRAPRWPPPRKPTSSARRPWSRCR